MKLSGCSWAQIMKGTLLGCQSLNYESEVVCKCYSPLLMKTERQEEAHGGGNS